MNTFRWRTTIFLIGLIAAFLSLSAWYDFSPFASGLFLFVALFLLLGVMLFGKRGV
jgi:hypothetical protein